VDVGEAFACPPLPSRSDILRALDVARCPFRQTLAWRARGIGRAVEGRLRKACIAGQPGCKFTFEERGGVFSPFLTYAVDLDVQLYRKDPLDQQSALALLELAKKYFTNGEPTSVRTAIGNEEEEEVAWADFDRDILAPESDRTDNLKITALVLVGFYTSPDGWHLPMDLAISCDQSNESADHRIMKIHQKLEERDYAKVLQKVRVLLKKRLDLRDWLVSRINANIGKLRFVCKQLGGPASAEYLAKMLGLAGLEDSAVRELWLQQAHGELQTCALVILLELRERLVLCAGDADGKQLIARLGKPLADFVEITASMIS